MKKLLALAVVLILAVSAVIGELIVTSPTAITLEPFAAAAPDGNSWVVENRISTPHIYKVDTEGKITNIYRTGWMQGGYQPVTAIGSDGEQLYYTQQSLDAGGSPKGGWTLWKYDGTGRATKLTEQPGIGMVKGVAAWQNSVWITTQDREGALVVYSLPSAGGMPEEYERLWLPAGRRTLRASYMSAGKVTVLLGDGTTVQTVNGIVGDSATPYPYGHGISELSMSQSVWLQLHMPIILITFVIIMLICALPVPLLLLYRRARRLLHRVWAVSTLGVLVTYMVAVVMLLMQNAGVQGEASLFASFEVAGKVATIIGQQNPNLLPPKGTESTVATQDFYALLGAQDDLLAVQNGALVIAASAKQPAGATPSYDKVTAAAVEWAVEGTNSADYALYTGLPVTVSACGIYSKGQLIGVLVARNGIDGLSNIGSSPLLWLAVIAAGVLVLLALWLRRMMSRMTAPIAQMTNKMEAIAAGDLTLWQVDTAHDELDNMCRTMQEMCMSLSIRDYEVASTLSSYSRFVPMGLHKLLGCASIQEVVTGDVRTITGTVGLLSITNRDSARAELSDDQFVHFVNSCCNTLSMNLDHYGGYLLSSAFDLTASKIFFDGSNKDAIPAALELIGIGKQQEEDILLPRFSLVLHHTGLLYGIASGYDKAFPFISSAELEFLQSYNENFCQVGVRLVLTEKLIEALGGSFKVRYIGFVASQDGQYTHKLYEALGVYSDAQYNIRVRYDDRLQEAIQLFYRSDFYLARNILSSMLRSAPDDGIVRWYLFACEHYFSCSEQSSVDFRLFGIDHPNN